VKFGPIPLAEATGAILAHSVKCSTAAFKKGRVLSPDDLAVLDRAGIAEIMAARLESGDVAEDEAAKALAEAAAGDGTEVAEPFTGRANLYAAEPGLAVVDAQRVAEVNAIDEALTIATIAPYDQVEPGQLLATIKIIPFAAPALALDMAVSIAAGDGPLVRVAPLVPHRAGLILTRSAGTKESVLEKTTGVTRDRLEGLGSRLDEVRICDHEAAEVAAAISELRQLDCRPILLFGASAIVDRRDVIPAAIELAGGSVDHFGMPVDPGNLLLLGRLGAVPVIGLPGCARSPKLNGFDWVLQRLLAGLTVVRSDLTALGAGGLLKEIPSRPQPRDGEVAEPPSRPRIAAIVLAAGQSRRTGRRNKLLAEIDGQPMVARVVDAVAASAAATVVVVSGFEAERLGAALAGRDLTIVHNPRFDEGLSTSLRTGLGALTQSGARVDGVMVCLGDMPGVKSRHIDALISAFDPLEGRAICVPVYQGKRGNPVLWGASLFAEIAGVAGDVGARHLIGEHAEVVCEVAIDDPGVLLDVDTPEALAALGAG
jgi:molybdenum cofactor cytidylyltransferase